MARSYCEELEFAGFTDWRLPTPIELLSVADYSAAAVRGVNPEVFQWTDGARWSSSLVPGSSDSAWLSAGGSLYSRGLGDVNIGTACVRPGVSPKVDASFGPPPQRYSVDGEVIEDVATGLSWLRCAAGLSGDACTLGDPLELSLDGASTYCSDIADAGGGWRIPRYKELESIWDRRAGSPAVDRSAFPNTPVDEPYWSATISPTLPQKYALMVDFRTPSLLEQESSIPAFFRCVK